MHFAGTISALQISVDSRKAQMIGIKIVKV
jgi:hypothetical protein